MDDINYARYAADFTKNQFHPITSRDHFAHRWVPIIVTGIFYWLIGINDLSSSLFGIITTLGTCWMIILITRNSGKQIQLVATLLYLLSYSTIFASHRLWPDTGISFFLLYSLYNLLHNNLNPILKGSLFSISLFASMLCKETVILFIPLILFVVIKDLLQKQNKIFWVAAGLVITILILLYLTIYWLKTGDPIFRYNTLKNNNYENICSFDTLPIEFTLKRIGFELWMAFIRNGDALVFIPALVAFFYREKLNQKKLIRLFTIYFFILLLSSNFMSISIFNYIPLCHDPRHFIFLIPFAAISGAPLLINFFKTPSNYPILPLIYLLTGCLLYLSGGGEIKFLYFLATFILVIAFGNKKNEFIEKINSLLLIIFISILLIRPTYDFFKVTYPQYQDLKNTVEKIKVISSSKPGILSCTDSFTHEMTQYFLKFQDSPISSRYLEAGNQIITSNNNSFLLITKSDSTKNTEYYIQHFFGPNIPYSSIHETDFFLLLSINSNR